MTARKPLRCGAIELVWDEVHMAWRGEMGAYALQVNLAPNADKGCYWELSGGLVLDVIETRYNQSTPQEAADDLAKFLTGLCGKLVAGGFGGACVSRIELA